MASAVPPTPRPALATVSRGDGGEEEMDHSRYMATVSLSGPEFTTNFTISSHSGKIMPKPVFVSE